MCYLCNHGWENIFTDNHWWVKILIDKNTYMQIKNNDKFSIGCSQIKKIQKDFQRLSQMRKILTDDHKRFTRLKIGASK